MACPKCGISFEELQPRMFSFNSPFGACEECKGLGIKIEFDPDLIIPDMTKSIMDGAIAIEPAAGLLDDDVAGMPAVEIFGDRFPDPVLDALAERFTDIHLLAGNAKAHDMRMLLCRWPGPSDGSGRNIADLRVRG